MCPILTAVYGAGRAGGERADTALSAADTAGRAGERADTAAIVADMARGARSQAGGRVGVPTVYCRKFARKFQTLSVSFLQDTFDW